MDYFNTYKTKRFMDKSIRSVPMSVESKIRTAESQLESRGITPPSASSRTLLDRFGDVLNVGLYSTMNATDKVLTDVQRNGLSYNTGKEAFTGFLEGLRAGNPFGEGYQEGEKTFGNILDKLGWDVDENKAWYTPERLAHGAVSLAGDIVFDPLTWINPLELGLGAVMKGTGKTLTGQTAKTVAKEAFKKNIDDIGIEAFRKLQQEAGLNASEEAAQGLINKVTRDAGYADKVGQGLNVGFGKHRATIIPDSTLRKIGDATIAPYVNTLGEKIGNTKYFKKAAQGAEKIFKSQESLNTRKLSRENPLEAAKKITKLDMYAPTFFKKYHEYMNNYIGRLSESFNGIDNATLNEISDVAEQEGVFKFVKKDVSQTVRNQRTPAMQKFVKDIEEHRDGLEKVINAYMERDANDANIKVLEGYKAKLDNILQSDSGMYDVLSKQSSSNVITDMDTNTLYSLFNDLRHKEVPAIARRLEEIGIPNSEQAAYEVRAMLDRNQQNIPVTELRNFLGDYIDKTASTMDNGRPFYDAEADFLRNQDTEEYRDALLREEVEANPINMNKKLGYFKRSINNRQKQFVQKQADKATTQAQKASLVTEVLDKRMSLLPDKFYIVEDGKRKLVSKWNYKKPIAYELQDMSVNDLIIASDVKDMSWFKHDIIPSDVTDATDFNIKTETKKSYGNNADIAESKRYFRTTNTATKSMNDIYDRYISVRSTLVDKIGDKDLVNEAMDANLTKWLDGANISRADYDAFLQNKTIKTKDGKVIQQGVFNKANQEESKIATLTKRVLKQRNITNEASKEYKEQYKKIFDTMAAMDEDSIAITERKINNIDAKLEHEQYLKSLEKEYMPVKNDVNDVTSYGKKSDKYLYHGTQADVMQMIDEEGNLVLNPSKNFNNKTQSVSLTEYENVAKDYATRNYGTTVRSAQKSKLIQIDLDYMKQYNLVKEAEEELAYNSDKPLIIPKGKWSVVSLADDNVTKGVDNFVKTSKETIKNMSNKELAETAQRHFAISEMDETFNNGGLETLEHAKQGSTQEIGLRYGTADPQFVAGEGELELQRRIQNKETTAEEIAKYRAYNSKYGDGQYKEWLEYYKKYEQINNNIKPYLELDEKWQDTKDYFENANVKDFSKNVLDSEPEPVHKFNIGGTEIIYGTDTTPDATVDSVGKALRNIGALGNNMRDFLSTLKIHLSDIEGWTEAATDSKGLIIFGKNINEKADYGRLIEKRIAPHEIGHNFTNQIKNLMFNESGGESRWLEAIRSDMNEVYSKNPVLNRTKDGKEWINYNMMNEDAASSFMLYLSNPVEFAKKFPNRADELQMALKRLKVPQANVKQGLNTKGFVVPRSAERTRTDMIEKLNKRSEDLIDTINTMPLQEAQKQFFEADMLSWNKYVNKDAEDMFKQLYPDDEMFADSIMTITKNFRELDTNSAVYQKFIEKFDPEMQEKITNFMRFMGEEYKRLYDVTSLADRMHVQELEGYQPHIQAIKPKPSDEPVYNMGNKFDRQRKVDMTIKQYNEWAKETNKNMPLSADGKPVRPYVAELETNAATLLMTYGVYSEQQIWTKKFYTYIVDTFGTKYDDLLTIPAGKDVYASTEDILEILRNPTLVNSTETMQKMGIPQDIIDAVSAKGDARRIPKSITKINKETFAELKNLSDNFYAFGMEDAVADSLNNMGMVQLNKTKNSFLKMYDTALRAWKVYNTSMNPGFHVRNAISNQFQSFLNVGSDALNPDTQFKAIKMLGKDERYLNNTRIDVQGKSYSLKQVLEYATSLGVVNGGQFKEAVTELGTPANPLQKMFNQKSGNKIKSNTFDKQSINPLNVDKFVPAKIGGEIGNKVEAQSRLANFLANLKQGKDFYESADNVTKYFFDYNDLSETERQVFKRLVPFYTWMRKNLPLQLEGMLTKPNVYRAYFKTKRNIENMIPEEQKIQNKDKNRFAQDWFQLPTQSEGENGIEPNFYNPNLPLAELNNIPRPTLDYAKQLMGMATPFVKLPMEMIMNKNLFFDSPISRGIGDTADAPGYWQRLTGGTKDDPTQMNPYMRYVLRNIGALENISKITMPSNSSDDTLQALVKTIAGQNLYSYDVNTFKKWANRDRLKMLQDLLNKEEEKRKAN